MTNPAPQGRVVEFAGVTLTSLLIGFLVGSLQHTLGFIPEIRQSSVAEVVRFSMVEGGLFGAFAGVITGWFCYYAVFQRRATGRDWVTVGALVAVVAVVVGLLVGLFNPDALLVSAMLMPGITVGIAFAVAWWRASRPVTRS
jgi:hypothetical protein